MIRHTGGWAWGATSTRSRSSACARLSASCVETIPIWDPSGPTKRTCGLRIRSLMRGSTETSHHLPAGTKRAPTDAPALDDVATIRPEYRCGSRGVSRVGKLCGNRADVRGLLALGAVHDVELDVLALGEGPVAVSGDRGEVDAHVVTIGAGDEA